ncbi:MAG: flagellar motor switch protein FliM [Spirochaetia bacterium]|nr:flagellar motor switch protein FliM [Spirochaetota bacterium]MDW8112573.1 flagellar motor switch protein FliM [Spirochaetia bacterium]
MTSVLSQEEIDSLLSALQTGGEIKETPSVIAAETPAAVARKNIKSYDFRRPDRFSKDQLRTLQMIHETFARLTSTFLSAQLRLVVQVHVASTDQLTYEEFSRSIPSPTTLGIINMEPLKGNAVLEIDPTITFVIIDRLFGGKGEALKDNRELTDIEKSVMESVIVRILSNLRESWANVIDLRPRLGNIEVNPQFAQLVPPTDMVVLITFDVKMGEAEGMMNLCVPYVTIEPIMSKLSAQYWYSGIKKVMTKETLDLVKDTLNKVELDLSVIVGSTTLKFKDVNKLKVGDVIRLDQSIKDNMIVKVENKNKFYCRPGKVGKKLSVQITGIIERLSEDILELVLREVED